VSRRRSYAAGPLLALAPLRAMMPPMDEWRRALRDARERLGLSRDEAACLSGVSMNTVKSYELGRRRPLRHHLGAVLTAYRLNREEQRPILEGAGDDRWVAGAPAVSRTA
jgi:transcriptional regulator with XRE-family HTH domain